MTIPSGSRSTGYGAGRQTGDPVHRRERRSDCGRGVRDHHARRRLRACRRVAESLQTDARKLGRGRQWRGRRPDSKGPGRRLRRRPSLRTELDGPPLRAALARDPRSRDALGVRTAPQKRFATEETQEIAPGVAGTEQNCNARRTFGLCAGY